MNSKNVLKFLKISLSAIAMSVALIFTGCKDDEEEVVTPGVTVPTPKAKVLVVHASPDAPGVGLLVDDVLINTTALVYPTNTGYLSVDAGIRNIKVDVFGDTTTVINANISLLANQNYSVFAGNSVADITAYVLTDDLTPPATGTAHVRFVHLSPDAPAVDVLADGEVLLGNTSFSGYTSFTPVEAGPYAITVEVASTGAEALNLGNITFEEGKIYTVFAKGFLNGTGAQALGAEIIVNN